MASAGEPYATASSL